MSQTHFKLTSISPAVQSVLKSSSCTLSIASLKKIECLVFITNTDLLPFKAFDLKVAQIFSLTCSIPLSSFQHLRFELSSSVVNSVMFMIQNVLPALVVLSNRVTLRSSYSDVL